MNNKKETDADNSKCLTAINESLYCKTKLQNRCATCLKQQSKC